MIKSTISICLRLLIPNILIAAGINTRAAMRIPKTYISTQKRTVNPIKIYT